MRRSPTRTDPAPTTSRATRAALALVLIGSVVPLAGFKPFSAVRDACPRCPPFADVVRLAAGGELVAHVMAQNLDALIIERFGEYRSLQRAEVAEIAWHKNERRNLPSHDQIVLKSGVVLHGTILRDNRDGYFVIRIGTLEHIAWAAQIESVYREGRPHPINEPTPAAGTAMPAPGPAREAAPAPESAPRANPR